MHGFGTTRAGADAPRRAVRQALGRSEFYPGIALEEVHETQTAWVFLAGDRAYKVRKPVRMAVPGFSTLEQRRLACLEELRVNRELAPAIGLRVRAMVPRLGSVVLADEGARGAVEYAIEMKRFDDARTMLSLARRGLLTDEQVAAVAQRLAAFHACAPRFSPLDRVLSVMRAGQRNIRELLALSGEDVARSVRAFARFADAFLLTHGHEIAARADAGLVRDGHGDLRAVHVVFDERLAIVGRDELDPRLREMDVADDVAGLVVDLERIGGRHAADVLVQRYWDAGGELCSPELLAFYGAQRALRRATSELLATRHLDDEAAAPARDRAGMLLRQAERLAWRARGPIVLMIGGPAVSGPSSLAAELARRSAFAVLSPDPPCAASYRAVGVRAREIVLSGESVIVDAPLWRPRLHAELIAGLGDSPLLHAFAADGATYSAWDEVRGRTTLTVSPPAGVEQVADQIAGWVDARRTAVWSPT